VTHNRLVRAVVFRDFGGPEVLRLEDLPDPTPGPGEVVLRVRAVSVMRTLDCEVRSRPNAFGPIPMPHVLGADPAGEVAAVGGSVADVPLGARMVTIQSIACQTCRPCQMGLDNACIATRIIGVHTQGGYAEQVVVPAGNLVPIPSSLSFEEATAIMTMLPTAWHLLVDRARLRAGETVLVMAAGGALGTAGVQVANLAGARVIAAAGADWKLERARALGADEVVNYRATTLSEEVKRLTDGWGADVVFENLSVPDLWQESLASAATLGRIVTCGALGGGSVETNMRRFYFKHLSLIGARSAPKTQVQEVYRLAREGRLKAIVHRQFPLAEACDAHTLIESRDVFGRVVLNVS
jgi:NADPH:quinone reductase-like Zn-dependent oxidoreductase